MTTADTIHHIASRCALLTEEQRARVLATINQMVEDNATVERLGIDVPKWAAEIRAKVAAVQARATLETMPEYVIFTEHGVIETGAPMVSEQWEQATKEG